MGMPPQVSNVVQPAGQLQLVWGARLFCQTTALPSVRQVSDPLTRDELVSSLLVETQDL